MEYYVGYRTEAGTPVVQRLPDVQGYWAEQVSRLFEYERSERVWLTFEEQWAGTPVAAQRYVEAWGDVLDHAWLAWSCR